MKPDFERAQNTATELLLQQDIKSLYIDVRDFKLPDCIHIDSIQNFCSLTGFPSTELADGNIDGACLLKKGPHRIILYDDQIENEQRKHWGICHELGHVFLDHSDDNKESEIEAHFFAAQIVMPEIVLWDILKRKGSITDYDIYESFNVSYMAANKRIDTLQRRSRFNSSLRDKQLLEKFKPLLDQEFSWKYEVS